MPEKFTLRDINLPAFFIVIVYPIILLALLTHYALNYSIGWFEIALLVTGYYGSNIAVGIGLHRKWSHHSYKTTKAVEFILAVLSAGTLQGPALSWASNHFRHHTYTDKDQDPHTPLKFDNKVLGFLWSHIGWMIIGEGSHKSIDRITLVKLGRNEILKWQLKYYWHIAIFMNTIMPMIIGFAFGRTALSLYVGFLFIGIGRALQQQATFCVNSMCHFLGSKQYYKGTAGDIWWMAIFLLGENWHNFHHAFPSDYRNGVKWYHFDVHKWIIYAMSKVGLAWDLESTPEIRIQAKMQEAASHLLEGRAQQFNLIQSRIDQLTEHVYARLSEFEHSSIAVKTQLKKSLLEMQESLKILAENLRSSIQLTEVSSEKMLKIASKKIKNIESAIYKLYNELSYIKSSN